METTKKIARFVAETIYRRDISDKAIEVAKMATPLCQLLRGENSERLS